MSLFAKKNENNESINENKISNEFKVLQNEIEQKNEEDNDDDDYTQQKRLTLPRLETEANLDFDLSNEAKNLVQQSIEKIKTFTILREQNCYLVDLLLLNGEKML